MQFGICSESKLIEEARSKKLPRTYIGSVLHKIASVLHKIVYVLDNIESVLHNIGFVLHYIGSVLWEQKGPHL